VQKPEQGHWGSMSGMLSEMGMESGEGRWCSGTEEEVVTVGRCVRKCEAREGVSAKMPKLSCRGLISGAACEIAKGGNGEGWCGGVYEVVVVLGLCARETRGERGGLGQNPKPSRRGSV